MYYNTICIYICIYLCNTISIYICIYLKYNKLLIDFVNTEYPGSSLVVQWAKDLELSLLDLEPLFWHQFDPWSRNVHILWHG